MTHDARADHRLRGPAQLLQAVPYLLGFHPHNSLVLVGLRDSMVTVTARLDLADAAGPVLADTLDRMAEGGTTQLVAVVYSDEHELRFADVPARLTELAQSCPVTVLDSLSVRSGRWRSLDCDDAQCCPRRGRELTDAPSSFAAAATLEGRAPLSSRAALCDVLRPLPDEHREPLRTSLQAAARAVRGGDDTTDDDADDDAARLIIAMARASGEARWSPPERDTVVSTGAALSRVTVRDALWLAVDARKIDGRALWRDLARRVPAPWDATPLFLYGWASWRAGDGARARIAAERTLHSDAGYHAADLLLAALGRGIDPRTFPKLGSAASLGVTSLAGELRAVTRSDDPVG